MSGLNLVAAQKERKIEVARRELRRIKEANESGLLVPEEIVEQAQHPDSPLHPFFDWQDEAAAHQWRLAQARGLIRRLKIVNESDPKKQRIPEYVSLMVDRGDGGYRSTEEVLESAELTVQLQLTAKAELESFVRKHAMLGDLVEQVKAIADGLPNTKKRKRPQKG